MKEEMNAIVATGYGDPEVLRLKKISRPQAKDNEILIKVMAASVTTADSMMRTGKPYIGRLVTGIRKPKHPVPGSGFAGIVEAIGKEVKKFKVGDHVFGETTVGFSTNAEFVLVPENGVLLPLPENLSKAGAAAFCDGYLTSMNFLSNVARLKPGQKILINGASGSLGTAAVQIAKYMGAEVTAVCSTRNTGLVKSMGADYVIDYTKKDFTKKGEIYDIVYDTIGKSSYPECRKILSTSGIYMSPVLSFSLLLQMMWTSFFRRNKAKFSATGLLKDEELHNLLAQLLEMIREGKIKPYIDRQYPLEKVAEAHRYIATGHKKGNLVIILQSEDQE